MCNCGNLDVKKLAAARFLEHLAVDLEEKCWFLAARSREAPNNAYSYGLMAPGLAELFNNILHHTMVVHTNCLVLEASCSIARNLGG